MAGSPFSDYVIHSLFWQGRILDGLSSEEDLKEKEASEDEDEDNLLVSTGNEDHENVLTFEIDASENELEAKAWSIWSSP